MSFVKRMGVLGIALVLTVSLQACNNKDVSQQTAQEHQHDHQHQDHGKADEHTKMGHEETTQPFDWKILEPQSAQAGKPTAISWQLTDVATGLPVRNFQKAHDRLSHLVVVSQDLSVFQHLHPEVIGPGKMKVETTFPKEGPYCLFLQFETVESGEQTLDQTLQVGTGKGTTARLVPDADQVKTMDGYTFKLSSYPTKTNTAAMMALNVEQNGKPVKNIQPYLGAGGHAVIISEDAQSFLHVHPMTEATGNVYQSPISFHTEISKPGLYKLWVQVRISGKLHTVDYTFEVKN